MPSKSSGTRSAAVVAPVEPPPSRWDLPDPVSAPPDDVVAVGGDLAPGTILDGYRKGLFPMHLLDGRLGWWSPWRRGIIPLMGMRVTRSLKRSARRYQVTVDRAFEPVIEGCANGSRPHGWINLAIRSAYLELNELGWAHSVECWDDSGDLAGGLYGVAIGGAFFGESMFHRRRDASKVALAWMARRFWGEGGRLIDVQWATDHLRRLGAVEVPRDEYLRVLRQALTIPGPALWQRRS